MLAKGHRSVNGKCVLLCTMVEIFGHKTTHVTSSSHNVRELTRWQLVYNKSVSGYGNSGSDLHSNCESVAVLQLGYSMGLKETRFPAGQPSSSTTNAGDFKESICRFHCSSGEKTPTESSFLELAKTLDISALGCVCHLPAALSDQRSRDADDPRPVNHFFRFGSRWHAPNPGARVKRQQEAGDVHLVGVEFLKPIG